MSQGRPPQTRQRRQFGVVGTSYYRQEGWLEGMEGNFFFAVKATAPFSGAEAVVPYTKGRAIRMVVPAGPVAATSTVPPARVVISRTRESPIPKLRCP